MADLRVSTVSKYVGDCAAMTLAAVYGPDDILASDVMPCVSINLAPIFALIWGAALPES